MCLSRSCGRQREQGSIQRRCRSVQRAATCAVAPRGSIFVCRLPAGCVLYSRDYFYCLLPFANQFMHGIMTPDVATSQQRILLVSIASRCRRLEMSVIFNLAFLTLHKDLLEQNARLNCFLVLCFL